MADAGSPVPPEKEAFDSNGGFAASSEPSFSPKSSSAAAGAAPAPVTSPLPTPSAPAAEPEERISPVQANEVATQFHNSILTLPGFPLFAWENRVLSGATLASAVFVYLLWSRSSWTTAEWFAYAAVIVVLASGVAEIVRRFYPAANSVIALADPSRVLNVPQNSVRAAAERVSERIHDALGAFQAVCRWSDAVLSVRALAAFWLLARFGYFVSVGTVAFLFIGAFAAVPTYLQFQTQIHNVLSGQVFPIVLHALLLVVKNVRAVQRQASENLNVVIAIAVVGFAVLYFFLSSFISLAHWCTLGALTLFTYEFLASVLLKRD